MSERQEEFRYADGTYPQDKPHNESVQTEKPQKARKIHRYLHLANGEVVPVTKKEYAGYQDESGTPHAYHRDGFQHVVIGDYPAEVELPKNEDDDDE